MAKQVEKFILDLDITGLEDLTGLKRSLKQLDASFKGLGKGGLDSLNKNIKTTINLVPQSINQFRQKERTLKSLRNEVKIGGAEFKRLGAAIEANKVKLQSFTQVANTSRGIFAGLGTGGAAAIGGAGAYIGSSLGLPPAISGLASAGAAANASKAGVGIMSKAGLAGGLAGAGIGAGVTAIAGATQFAGESASYAAEIQKLQIALKGVTKNQADFTKGLNVISTTSRKLNVPIAASTRQFTTLSASVLGAGGTIEDAEEVFTGVSNAIKATGGNAEDVQSAIRAMSQIFGKGKVSAEELQGQLGERLAGAVVKFAEANGSSLQKLQKDLRDGTVGLGQIMNFAKKLNLDFSKIAEEVSDSSADAGQRLKTSMDRLKLAVGTILQPIGAEFQKVFGEIVDAITFAIEAFNKFMGIGLGNAILKTERDLERARQRLIKSRGDKSRGSIKGGASEYDRALLDFQNYTRKLEELRKGLGGEGGNKTSNLPDATTAPSEEKINKYKLDLGLITQEKFDSLQIDIEAQKIFDDMSKVQGENFKMTLDQIKEKLRQNKEETFNFKKSFKELYDSVTDLGTNIGEYAIGAVDRLADSFVDLMVTGKASFSDLARSILQDLQKMILKALLFQLIFDPFKKAFGLGDGGVLDGGEVKKSAKGNVFAQNKIVPYSYGGVVNRPSIFPLANGGVGLMAEAGSPEAIMPLKRGANGKLGVESSGGMGNVVVNVDAKGTSAQGDDSKSKEMGRLIGVAIEAELVKQKRPGGLLYS
tara:strand:- start:2737 stop:5022 length:2286 start_codon:yes stop_codon:yes gene_type:complete